MGQMHVHLLSLSTRKERTSRSYLIFAFKLSKLRIYLITFLHPHFIFSTCTHYIVNTKMQLKEKKSTKNGFFFFFFFSIEGREGSNLRNHWLWWFGKLCPWKKLAYSRRNCGAHVCTAPLKRINKYVNNWSADCEISTSLGDDWRSKQWPTFSRSYKYLANPFPYSVTPRFEVDRISFPSSPLSF